ncbi:MAG: AarF/ABC1/UbiB kinase family protein [Myxococcales bacterium]|nr:AarF/ABC1/UbiB kinase family protein [Myxococcales bacterium]
MHATRFVARTLAIGFFLVKQGLRFWLVWLGLVLTLRPKARRQEWFAACVLALFRDLGATFIKVGQIMSTRPDLLPPHIIHALETLQDNVGPFPFSEVQRTISAELGRPLGELFAEFSPTPIASASVAQVHKARLESGRIVAVKIKRPKIDAIVEFDLLAMRLFAQILELAPSLRLLAPVETVAEFGRGIRMQLDFTLEADNNRRFQRLFEGDRDVLFPGLVDELCTRSVLVMDFIEGKKVLAWVREQDARPDRPASSDDARKRLAQIGFRVLLKMIFEDGFVHADLHPGNIFITADERVAILDLGLVGELDATHRGAFARYFAAWASGDGKTMARLMSEMSPSREIPNYPAFETAVSEFVARWYGKRLGEVEVSKVFFDMMGILRRHRVRVNATFTLVNIAIAVTEGIGKQLDPDVDLMATALPFFARHDFFTAAAPPPPPGQNGVHRTA